jgi:hypothetical protein
MMVVGGILVPVAHAQIIPQIVVDDLPLSTTSVLVLLQTVARETGMSATTTSLFEKVPWCESKYDTNAVGDKGTSFGIFQIHLPAHLDITKEEALDPTFSANWAADEFVHNRQNIWTCTHIVESGNAP